MPSNVTGLLIFLIFLYLLSISSILFSYSFNGTTKVFKFNLPVKAEFNYAVTNLDKNYAVLCSSAANICEYNIQQDQECGFEAVRKGGVYDNMCLFLILGIFNGNYFFLQVRGRMLPSLRKSMDLKMH